ncbi:MAG: hypothetical protein AB7L65_03955 [Hyphomonadaceae bacterium]
MLYAHAMTAFPVAASLSEALQPGAPEARTEERAAALAGGPVFLAVEETPAPFATPAAAEAAFPDLYGGGRFELYWRDEAWRVALRYWRPAAPAPVARTAAGAVRRPLGHARTPQEARAQLGAPAELVREIWPQLYANRKRLLSRWGEWIAGGLAEITEREGKLAVAFSYWRPAPPPGASAPLTPAERTELAERIAAPLRAEAPQAPLDFGLFERPAPENPDIVLAEEGDGRVRGE